MKHNFHIVQKNNETSGTFQVLGLFLACAWICSIQLSSCVGIAVLLGGCSRGNCPRGIVVLAAIWFTIFLIYACLPGNYYNESISFFCTVDV